MLLVAQPRLQMLPTVAIELQALLPCPLDQFRQACRWRQGVQLRQQSGHDRRRQLAQHCLAVRCHCLGSRFQQCFDTVFRRLMLVLRVDDTEKRHFFTLAFQASGRGNREQAAEEKPSR